MLEIKEDKHRVGKVEDLLRKHKAEIIEELGAAAFDLLSPRQARIALGLEHEDRRKREQAIPELTRQGWLEPAPADSDVGSAHLYSRWRVEFVKRFKKSYKKP